MCRVSKTPTFIDFCGVINFETFHKLFVDTYTSHLYPDAMVVRQGAIKVRGELAGVNIFVQSFQAGQIGLK